MARVNVYLPDDLAERARGAGLNISSLTQEAVRHRLAGLDTAEWLAEVRSLPPLDVSHDAVLRALDEAKEEFGT